MTDKDQEIRNRFMYTKDDVVPQKYNTLCINCRYRDKYDDESYHKLTCEKYKDIKHHKPFGVLEDGDDCDYYEPEKE